MNEPSKKMGLYVLGGAVALCLFLVLGWFALREEPSPPNQQPAQIETMKSPAHVAPAFEPLDEVSNETPTNHPDDSASTNAAVIYRQAFALFDALSEEQKSIVSDWRTNVDASVETELCEKLRPICDLMHQAASVTNSEWGIDPKTFGPKMSDLNGARSIARAAIWSAAHCQSNDVTGATDDAVSVLQLDRQISRNGSIVWLVDMPPQKITSAYVAQNLGLFRGANGQRLATAFNNPAYEEAPSRAMEQEADTTESLAAHLASQPAANIREDLSWFDGLPDANTPEQNRDLVLAQLRQVVDAYRELAKVLASSSDDEYEAWLKHSTELQTSNALAKEFLQAYDWVVDRVRQAKVQRGMVVAGLAVAENGTEALSSYPDPVSGKPLVYTKTDDGFELQSTFEFNDKPFKIQFK